MSVTTYDLECYEVRVWDDDGQTIYQGPRFVRCYDCRVLHTIREINEEGGCKACGVTKFKPAFKLTPQEKIDLVGGVYKMHPWERAILEGNKAA